MEFKLYANENMTTEFGMAFVHDGAEGRLSQVSFTRPDEVKRGVMYLGSPNTGVQLQTRVNSGNDDVVVSVADALAGRVDGADVAENAVFGVGGFIYRVETAGRLAVALPHYETVAGAKFADGTAHILCLGARHAVSAVKLALSEDGLASGSHSLILGKTIKGGAALAIWYEITNRVGDYYDALSVPMLSLELNDCVVLPSGAFGD